MSMNLGTKIRKLRKSKDISQEVLAQLLGVSFQAVSKWETGTSLPDITLIPAIASFFGVSTDELFDYNRLTAEKKITSICAEAAAHRITDRNIKPKMIIANFIAICCPVNAVHDNRNNNCPNRRKPPSNTKK